MAEADSSGPVLIAGWVGSDNLGDELIHRRLIHELQNLGLEPTSVSIDPESTTAIHGVPAVRFGSLFAALGDAKGLVFGGGTLIQQDSSLLNTAVHLQRLRLARWRRVPAVTVGLGIGRVRTPGAARAVRREFRHLRRVVVRDHDSASALQAIGVTNAEVGCDLVFAEPTPATSPDDVQAVGLRPPLAGGIVPTSIRRKQHSDEWIGAMAAALDASAVANGLTTRFIAMDRHRDHAVHTAVADRMNTAVELVRPELDTVIGEFAAARVTIGMRYHAAVASLVGGRPAVGLDYSQKVASLATESLETVQSVPITEAGVAGVSDAVSAVLERSERVPEAVAAQQARMPVVREALGALL